MLNRRGFISSTGALLGATTISPAPVAAQATVTDPWARTPAPDSFDPWVEVIADAIRNNVRQLNRFSGCRLMAVIKNNANGIGLREIGPILDAMDVPVTEIRLGGGGARSPLWRQVQADVYHHQVTTLAAEEGAAYGAALLA
ncbi:MAG: FGGY-family carbohydrate kinase, partial [Vicinamibacterales bacterium]|nr:FGGY-family carbohydrate kinase [Vicinamibacterales bacterium]